MVLRSIKRWELTRIWLYFVTLMWVHMRARCSSRVRLSVSFVYFRSVDVCVFFFPFRVCIFLFVSFPPCLSLRPFVSVKPRPLIINSSSYHEPITRKIFCRQYFKPSHQRLVHLKVSQSQVSAIPGRILNHPIKSEPSKDGLIFSSFTEAAHLLSP